MSAARITTDAAQALRAVATLLELQPTEAPQAITVSQVNCEAVLGIPKRRYLELVRDSALPVIALGKLRLVRLDQLLLHLQTLAKRRQPAPADAPQDGAADVLGEVLGPQG